MEELFSNHDASGLLDGLQRKLTTEIKELDGDYVLNASEIDLAEHFVSKYTLDVPVLHEDAIHVHSQDDAKIDVSGDQFRHFHSPGPHYITGTRVTIAVPYSGGGDFFRYRPNARRSRRRVPP
jgi:hypothetical protein